MLRSKTCIWPVVAAALWTGCAFGPLGSYRAVSPVDYEGLDHLSVAPKSLTGSEIDTILTQFEADDLGLLALSAGQSYAWCVVCKDTFKYPQHTNNFDHGGSRGGGGGSRNISRKAELRRALYSLLFLFLIVAAMPD